MDLYDAVKAKNIARVQLLLEQGADKDKKFGEYEETPLFAASKEGHLPIVQLLVEQGADMEETDYFDRSPLYMACCQDHFDTARYLLEQGADRDKAITFANNKFTPLHAAAIYGHLEITKLLMVYGADLNAKDREGRLPIDVADNEEIKQAIRDEPRRRMDGAPGKRATEQDRHPDAATSASAQQEDVQINNKPRLDEGTEAEEGKVAEEDEDSEPSDGEDD